MLKNVLVTVGILIFILPGFSAAEGEEDLAKKSQNPVGNMISVPLEYWHYDGMPNDSSADALIAKPVYPVSLGKINLINRFIVPYLGIDATSSDQDLNGEIIPASNVHRSGLGNIQYQGFLTSADPGPVILGVGPVFEFPTHSSGLGSDKVSGGVAFLALSMPGNWVFGALAQNMWSFAGPSDAEAINKFLFQYFINYNLDKGWYLTSTPVMTADWEESSNNRWTIPLGGGIGKLHRFGKQPVDFNLQAFTNVEKPENGPSWSMMFAVKFLFPKG